MKKLISIFLACLLLLSFTFCAFADGEDAAAEDAAAEETAVEEPAAVEEIEEIADIEDISEAKEPGESSEEQETPASEDSAPADEEPADEAPAVQPAPQTAKKLSGARLCAVVGLCLIGFGGIIWVVGQLKVKKHRKKKD